MDVPGSGAGASPAPVQQLGGVRAHAAASSASKDTRNLRSVRMSGSDLGGTTKAQAADHVAGVESAAECLPHECGVVARVGSAERAAAAEHAALERAVA